MRQQGAFRRIPRIGDDMDTKIMVAGDWHGDTEWARNVVRTAGRRGLKKIVQCGDFGIWTHLREGHSHLDTVNEEARKHGVKVYFIGGNHENWDHLDFWVIQNAKTSNGHVFVRSHILYIPDGCRWAWNDKVFMGVGGAVSVDKGRRKLGESWWAQEQVDESLIWEIEQRKLSADFLFTHDCPTNAPFQHRFKPDSQSQMHRQLMDRLGRAVRPQLWFHGHMHEKYDGYDFPMYESHTKVYGLEMNHQQWNWGVLDTAAGSFTWNQDFVRNNNS